MSADAERPPDPRNAEARVAAGSSADTGRQTSTQNTTEASEHRNERRRFLVWAVLCGFASPDRLTERIVDEIEREAP